MLKAHEELAATLAAAEKQALAIVADGGNAMAIVHAVREAQQLNDTRLVNYRDAAPKPKK